MADRRQQEQQSGRRLFKLDPNLIRISEEEIRADLLYRGERPRPLER
jgi:hypothetical protein